MNSNFSRRNKRNGKSGLELKKETGGSIENATLGGAGERKSIVGRSERIESEYCLLEGRLGSNKPGSGGETKIT